MNQFFLSLNWTVDFSKLNKRHCVHLVTLPIILWAHYFNPSMLFWFLVLLCKPQWSFYAVCHLWMWCSWTDEPKMSEETHRLEGLACKPTGDSDHAGKKHQEEMPISISKSLSSHFVIFNFFFSGLLWVLSKFKMMPWKTSVTYRCTLLLASLSTLVELLK